MFNVQNVPERIATPGASLLNLEISTSVISKEDFEDFLEDYIEATPEKREKLIEKGLFRGKNFITVTPVDDESVAKIQKATKAILNRAFEQKLTELQEKGIDSLKDFDETYSHNEDFILRVLEIDLQALAYIPKKLLYKKEFLFTVLDQFPGAIDVLTPWLNESTDLTIDLIHLIFEKINHKCAKATLSAQAREQIVNWFILSHKLEEEVLEGEYTWKIGYTDRPKKKRILDKLGTDRDQVLRMMLIDAESAAYMSQELQEDTQFMHQAILLKFAIAEHICVTLGEDYDFIFGLINQLKAEVEAATSDFNALLTAFKRFSQLCNNLINKIEYSSIQSEVRCVFENTKKLIAQTLGSHKEQWLKFVKLSPELTDVVPAFLGEDLDFIVDLCEFSSMFSVYNFLSLKDNPLFWQKYLTKYKDRAERFSYHASQTLKQDRHYIRSLIAICPSVLRSCHSIKDLRQDADFILDCAKDNLNSLESYEGSLSLTFLEAIYAIDPSALSHINRECFESNIEVTYQFVSTHLDVLKTLPTNIRENKKFVEKMAEEHPETIEELSSSWENVRLLMKLKKI